MKSCPACHSALPDDNNCCGWVWKYDNSRKIKLDFLAKGSDRKNASSDLTHNFLPKTSPVSHWAFLFGKNK